MFRLRTLGAALLEGPEGAPAGAGSQRRHIALLAVLAASRQGVSRERIVGMLWPESPEERARHALAQLLYTLRRDLGEEAVGGGSAALRLDRTLVSSDIDELEGALERGELERAVDLYRGPFLDGFYLNGCPEFERWVEEERARIAHRIEAAYDRLALRARQGGDRDAEVGWLSRLALLTPLDGRVAVSLVQAMAAGGNRTGALRHARMHEARVRAELGCAPDPALTKLVGELGAEEPLEAPPRRSVARRPTVADEAEPTVAGQPTSSTSAAQAGSRTPRLGRRAAFAAGALVAFGVLATVGLSLVSTPSGQPRDWALIADVENGAGDPVFDRTVPVALAASLTQSRTVYVLPPSRVQTALERMRRTGADSVLREPLARELAVREGVAVVIVPSVVRADSSYELGARLVDPATGGILDAVTVRAERRADVINALDRLGRRLRRHLGESMLYVASHAVPLPQVTTPSLDALELFAEGARAFQENRLQEAEAEWTGAVAIDSTFASALAALGGYYYWTNRQALGDAYFGRALAHLGSLPERDRVLVRARAAGWRGDRDTSTRLLNTYLDGHPDDIDALGMLAYDYVRLRRSAEAVDVLSRLAALDSTSHVTFINLATAERQLGRYREAITHYRRAFALMPSLEAGNNNLNLEYGGTFVSLGQPDSAAAVFSEMLKGDALTRARGLRSLAFLAMYRGRYRDACADLGEALALLPPASAAVSTVRDRLLLFTALGQRGADRAARAQLDSAYALTSSIDAEPTLLFWVGKAVARAGEVGRAEALRERMRTRVHEGSATDRAAFEGIEGEILLARQRAREAIPHLEAALHADSTDFTLESLANAVASAGALDRADTLYRALAAGQEFGWEGQEYWHLAEYQVGRLEELAGRTRESVGAYERFLALWPDADPDLPVVLDARSRLSRLRPEKPVR
jgi:DNA-binding SARP family transcriptional activator/tetratricopeptide (TPR) repeat protein